MSDDVERIKARLTVVDVVGKRVPLKKAGKDFVGLCPFHDDSKPSMHVSPRMGIYKCFACGAGGDLIKFVMELDRLSFREALQVLAEEAGITLSGGPSEAPDVRKRREGWMQLAHRYFLSHRARSREVNEYCAGRGLTPEVCSDWGLGYAPPSGEGLLTELRKAGADLEEARSLFLIDLNERGTYYDRFRGRLMFPILDERGSLVAFGGRLLDQGQPKYINSSDTPLYSKRRVLYGMHRARARMSETGRGVLVEGYLDAIACHRSGVTEAVASLGTATTEEQAKMLSRWVKEVVILFDADSAGQKAAERAEALLQAEGIAVKIALMPEGEDPDTMLRRSGPEAVRAAVDGGLTPIQFKLGRLRTRLAPDEEAFWDEAFSLLATARHDLEIERHVVELAAMYPGITDVQSAARAIRREVSQRRHRPAQVRRIAPLPPRGGSLHAAEISILRGLFEGETHSLSWEAIHVPELWITAEGAELARQLADHPAKQPGELPEDLQARVAELTVGRLVGVRKDEVRDAMDALRRKAIERRLPEMRGALESEDDLQAYQSVLRNLKAPKE